MDHVLPGHPRVTLLRCPDCGAASLQDLTVPDYETGMAAQLDYYVEQGAGIDCIVAPLLRLPRESVRRCLDIGCSFGFALDFSRHALGWEVLGVDPSPLAAAGAAALDLPVRRCYFSADLDLGPEPFDLVLCSEILEHLAAPQALLAAMRERLSPEGLLVLSTPNLAIVRRETAEGTLRRALSPGLHLVLYDAARSPCSSPRPAFPRSGSRSRRRRSAPSRRAPPRRSASAVRRAAFEQAGGFDEALSGYEDDDLFVRFFRLGWEHVFVDRALLRFRIHANCSSTSRRFIDSRLRYAEKLATILPNDPRFIRNPTVSLR